jgi:hypothetical protein
MMKTIVKTVMTTVAITVKTTGVTGVNRIKVAVVMSSMRRGKRGIGDG